MENFQQHGVAKTARSKTVPSGTVEDRRRVARAVVAPEWYYVVFALCAAAFVLSFGVPGPWATVLLMVVVAVVFFLTLLRPRVTQVQRSAWGRESSAKVGMTQSILFLALAMIGVAAYLVLHQTWVLVAAAVLAALLMVFGAKRIEYIYIFSLPSEGDVGRA